MSIQTCESLDGKLADVRDYSSKTEAIAFLALSPSSPLVPVYILSVFSVFLVTCFIWFFHCENRRQKSSKNNNNNSDDAQTALINASDEST